MNKEKKLEISVFIADLSALLISYILATVSYLLIFSDNEIFFRDSFFHTLIHFVISFVIAEFFTLYRSRLFMMRNRTEELYSVIKVSASIVIATSFLAFLFGNSLEISRGVVVSSFVYFVVVDYIARSYLKRFFNKRRKTKGSKLLIVSTLKLAKNERIRKQIESGLMSDIVGYAVIDKSSIGKAVSNYPVVADIENVVSYVNSEVIDGVLVLLDNGWWDKAEPIIEQIQSTGVVVHIAIDALSKFSHYNRSVNHIGNYPVLSYAEALPHEEPLILKRTMDIIGEIIGSFIAMILTIILGPIIYFESPGPVFFKQKRVGRNGRIFEIYKFRSMSVNAEEEKHKLMKHNEVDGHMFKMTNDPRVTRVGKFIRATSLDEFPQFFNVLKGDMSLIGTRPPTVDEYEKYEPRHKRRLSMKPGITGKWQVSGRSNITDFEEVMRMDLEYIDNYTLQQDLKILLKTFVIVFTKAGSR